MKEHVQQFLKDWFESGDHVHCHDLLDFQAMKGIISLCLPLRWDMAHGTFLSGSCQLLWEGLNHAFRTHMDSLTFNKVEANECELFSHLVYSFYKHDLALNP